MKYRRYAEYKDSGVEWLGEVPYEWGTAPLRWYASVRSGDFVSNTDFDESPGETLSVPVMGGNGIMGYTNKHNVSESTIVIGRVGALCGNVHQTTSNAWVTDNALILQITQDFDARYLWYALTALDLNRLSSQTAQPLVTGSLVKSQRLPLPTISEQARIASFLDRETAQIDALITKQERLIAVLQEKRQALISHAVTKGLNPDAPMKESGVEWLGEVPAHWEVTKLGHLCDTVLDGPHFSPEYVAEGIPFLSTRNVRVDRWALDDVKYISEQDYRDFCKRVTPERGDILYTKGGTTGVARVADFEQPFHVWVHIAVLKVRRELVSPHFLAYSLNAKGCYEQSQLYTRGATNNDLGLSRMVRIVLTLPPLYEQSLIEQHLLRETAKIDVLITRSQDGMSKLRERRSTLISAAVTGKIDVHE